MLGLLKDLRIGGWCEIEQITCWVLIAVETFPGISAKSQIAGPKKGTGRGLVLSWEQSSGWRVYKIEASGQQNIHRFLQLSKTEIWVTHVTYLSIRSGGKQTHQNAWCEYWCLFFLLHERREGTAMLRELSKTWHYPTSSKTNPT